jgi:hypothetical protein
LTAKTFLKLRIATILTNVNVKFVATGKFDRFGTLFGSYLVRGLVNDRQGDQIGKIFAYFASLLSLNFLG